MIIHKLQQGSSEWQALRRSMLTASEASAMMGASTKTTRTELLRMKATGSEKEFSDWVQKNLLDKGHAIEEQARPFAEALIGEELYPVTGSSEDHPMLLASMDGLTMLSDCGWECKSWNEEKAAAVRAGAVPTEDYWQVIQQLLVSGASRWIYTVSDGTPERTVHVEQAPDKQAFAQLLAGWQQFSDDLKGFSVEQPKAEVIGTAPETLPALTVEVSGMVKASNLDHFKRVAQSVLGAVNVTLENDQDFADAEKTVKWCSNVEERLELVKSQILAQTADIDEVFRTIDEISAQTRGKRLELDKLVKTRKTAIRDEIVLSAKRNFEDYLSELESSFGGKIRMPAVPIDVAGAIKGKKTIDSLRNSADTELARAKVAAKLLADKITSNLALLKEQAAGYEFLFADAQALVQKEADDLAAVISVRVNEQKATEQKRIADELERKRLHEESLKQQASPAPAAPVTEAGQAPAQVIEPTAHVVAPITQQAPVMVNITAEELSALRKDSLMLQALIAAGVDNWEGYDDAMHMLEQDAA